MGKTLLSLFLVAGFCWLMAGCDGPTTPPPPSAGTERGKEIGDARKAQIEAEKARQAADAQQAGQ